MWNILKKIAAKADAALAKDQEKKRDPGIYEDWKKPSPVAAVAKKPVPPPPAPAPVKPTPVVTGARPAAKPLFKDSNANVDASRLQNDLITGKITQQQYDEKMAELKKRYPPA
jgi:hypothetical protein